MIETAGISNSKKQQVEYAGGFSLDSSNLEQSEKAAFGLASRLQTESQNQVLKSFQSYQKKLSSKLSGCGKSPARACPAVATNGFDMQVAESRCGFSCPQFIRGTQNPKRKTRFDVHMNESIIFKSILKTEHKKSQYTPYHFVGTRTVMASV